MAESFLNQAETGKNKLKKGFTVKAKLRLLSTAADRMSNKSS